MANLNECGAIMKKQIILLVIFISTVNLFAKQGFNLIATIKGESSGDAFSEVCGLGDINQDGYDDFAVGAWESNNGGGYVHIYFGGSELDTVPDLRLTGGTYFGWAMDSGDFNGDGVPDLIVSAPYADYWQGQVSIFYGGENMDDVADIVIDGTRWYGFFGESVANAGDMNGDGYPDFIVGECTRSDVHGYLYVFYGGPDIDANWEYCMQGLEYESLGLSCDGIGDINLDGYDDVIVGTLPDEILDEEFVYIIYGGDSLTYNSIAINSENCSKEFGRYVSGLGDIDNDSIPELFVSSSSNDTYHNWLGNIYSTDNLEMEHSFKGFSKNGGIEAVTGNIDFNNDGFNDLMVGYGDWTNMYKGRILCFSGGNDFDTIPDYILYGNNNHQYFGCSIDEIGNVNDDLNKEIVIGQRGKYFYVDNPEDMTYGKVFIYSFGEMTSIDKEKISNDFYLRQNYPNPFNSSTTIEFVLNKKSDIKLSVFNIRGSLVEVIEDNSLNQGRYRYTFDATGLTSGVYFYQLDYENNKIIKKMIYLK